MNFTRVLERMNYDEGTNTLMDNGDIVITMAPADFNAAIDAYKKIIQSLSKHKK